MEVCGDDDIDVHEDEQDKKVIINTMAGGTLGIADGKVTVRRKLHTCIKSIITPAFLDIQAPNATIESLPAGVTYLCIRRSDVRCCIPETVKRLFIHASSIADQIIKQDIEIVIIVNPCTRVSGLQFTGSVDTLRIADADVGVPPLMKNIGTLELTSSILPKRVKLSGSHIRRMTIDDCTGIEEIYVSNDSNVTDIEIHNKDPVTIYVQRGTSLLKIAHGGTSGGTDDCP